MLNLIHVALILIFFFVYAWPVYNLPLLAIGVKHLRRKRVESEKRHPKAKYLRTFSIVVPAKNEEKVIGRLLDALSKLNYPADKVEIIIVVDGSTDRTLSICMEQAKQQKAKVKILRKRFSDGKPSALNYGIKCAKGEIIGIFDADNVPAQDTLLNVSRYFENPEVAAVQGKILSINSEENMLTKFISYEEIIWCETYLRGKDALSLFVHLKGNCQFIRRDVLENLKGFDERALAEDIELSARLTEKGYKISYAPDVYSWQENTADLKQLFRQRTRWFRGHMEVALRYGRLIAKPNKRSVDAEATLFAPFILIASLMTYFASFYIVFMPFSLSIVLEFLTQFTAIIATLTILVCGLALIYSSKPRKVTSLLWLPFIYFYWSLQAFLAFYAFMLILFHRPSRWLKTEKRGVIKTKSFS
jgi:cellulose synthase/poly-beta-1,6-N-acetylglucosamine synthase-like glycosyltransferase